ncbi:hypothetical protein EXIGLDRAFT_832783 [Exidia glandulosa HHB12029]|uniref:Uncharacterized protein n=1 Tax=Exidia glandulosa HHB12029 TaxID=1314781 RepID=A0A165L8S6_EXIGL|nr:hypothetical protein EXIGLDRAFT_832783 [Exidia glandulosa HHB12029]
MKSCYRRVEASPGCSASNSDSRWSDRDIFMRMRGGGVGYATRTARVAEEPKAQRAPAGEPERCVEEDAIALEEDENQGAETEVQVHENDEPAPDDDEDDDDEGEDEGSEEEGEEEDDLVCDSGEEDGQDNVDDLAMEDDDDLDYCD